MKGKRIVIYPKDIQKITGRTLRYAQSVHRTVRKRLGKSRNHFITVDEFCEHFGLTPDDVEDSLAD